MKKDRVLFIPISIYTAMVISLGLFKNSMLFTKVALLVTLVSAVAMGVNAMKSEAKYRLRISIGDFLYCILIYFTIDHISFFIKNIYASLLAILIYVVYVVYINPKFFKRTMITK